MVTECRYMEIDSLKKLLTQPREGTRADPLFWHRLVVQSGQENTVGKWVLG